MPETEEFFDQLVAEWEKETTPYMSVDPANTKCPAFRTLCEMGIAALPQIKRFYEAYESEDSDTPDKIRQMTLVYHGFPALVSTIAGNQYSIPQEISGKMGEIKKFTKNWLDERLPPTS